MRPDKAEHPNLDYDRPTVLPAPDRCEIGVDLAQPDSIKLVRGHFMETLTPECAIRVTWVGETGTSAQVHLNYQMLGQLAAALAGSPDGRVSIAPLPASGEAHSDT